MSASIIDSTQAKVVTTDIKRIVIVASGGGSNAQMIIDACANFKIPGEVCKIISNIPSAGVLSRADQSSIPSVCIDHTEFESRDAFDRALSAEIDAVNADVIVLAGFMRILSKEFVNKYLGKLLNIHPSLLPKYPGLNTHQRAIDADDKEHGTSVHFVTPELDGGPVILQAKVPVFEDDTADELAQRVLVQEHEIYPLVVGWLCTGRVKLSDYKAYLDDELLSEKGYASD